MTGRQHQVTPAMEFEDLYLDEPTAAAGFAEDGPAETAGAAEEAAATRTGGPAAGRSTL